MQKSRTDMQDLRRRYLGVAVFLLLLLPITWGIRAGRVAAVSEHVDEYQARAVTEALAYIEDDLDALQRDMIAEARVLARTPVVVHALRDRRRSRATARTDELVRFFAQLETPRHGAVELYDLTPQLIAWQGYSMPLDAAPESVRFLRTYQTAVAHDDERRQALVVWWPVREGNRVLGAIRIMRLVRFQAPVQNQYLRSFGLEDAWQRTTQLALEVHFGLPSAPEVRAGQQVRQLQGRDGAPLGYVVLDPPSADQLLGSVRARFDDVMAFWATLLLCWLMAGLWWWYQTSCRQAEREEHVLWRFMLVAAAWWGLRYALLALEVPARWQPGKAPLSPLFDPTHLASALGGGLLRSTGDLLLTALFGLSFALAVLDFMHGVGKEGGLGQGRIRRRRLGWQVGLRLSIVVFLATGLVAGLAVVLGLVTRHVALDSTLDYFARVGLVPEPLVLIVFCALLLITGAIVVLATALMWSALSAVRRYASGMMVQPLWWATAALAAAAPLVVLYGFFDVRHVVPLVVTLALLVSGVGLAVFGVTRRRKVLELLALRSVLSSVFLLSVLLYPAFYYGMEARQRIQVADIAESFAEGQDPRVLFAIEQVLQEAQDAYARRDTLDEERLQRRQHRLDSLAQGLVQGSLLAALGGYDVSMTFFDTTGAPLGRYYEPDQRLDASVLDQVDLMEFDILQQMYRESRRGGVLVEQVTGRREPERLQYAGITPVYGDTTLIGWTTVRAEPQASLRHGETPFPRVLLPAGAYDERYAHLSIAEFRDGLLVRSIGRDFGRYRLAEKVQRALSGQAMFWRVEQVEGRSYQTYYWREERRGYPLAGLPAPPAVNRTVVAVRVPAVSTFDHLYYLLRLTVAGLFIGLPLYLLGLYVRRRAGLLPAPRARFRDKVLNAFLSVGIISVAAVGMAGLGVVTSENERTTQSWLRQHLERVEELLALDARGEEMAYRVLERTHVDSLAVRVGLDLNVYKGYRLIATSRPQLVQERLIDRRLPSEAYKALYVEGYRVAYTDEHVGSFTYTTGFQALPDEQGQPAYIISIPTLPEQERIEEERARTVAYLFGALLLLMLVVMLTASLLANALTRPMVRLRAGLQAVARGRFERMLPVESRDEIGELVETFNKMQEQLAESRRQLAQQERQLAWREMARQVAHEIKNPLTPMKLSVQHLRRAFLSDARDAARRERFDSLFERITATLIEQIDALARIANEFHSFARMPSRILERLDLNAVVSEAVSLMQEESEVDIVLNLSRAPLIIEADREELRRNYINLIKNAIQAIPEDRKGRVKVKTARQEDLYGNRWAYSTVVDNGTGISEELRERIFEPNFSTKTSGTGLGLAIVNKSVEELHGEIGFETEEQVGTTFWMRFPLVDDEEQE